MVCLSNAKRPVEVDPRVRREKWQNMSLERHPGDRSCRTWRAMGRTLDFILSYDGNPLEVSCRVFGMY